MTLTESIRRAPRALGLLSSVFVASCTLELAGTGPSRLPQTDALDAGVHSTAAAQATAGTCQADAQTELTFEPRAPAALILIDRSSSMFEDGHWEPVKASVLEAVRRWEHEMRFGLATYTGEHDGECPALAVSTELARDNARALSRAYERLEQSAYKGETPTAAALSQVAQMLAGDAQPGAKYILLVTDGDPDFCDDGDPTCARDAVVAAAQAAYAQGIETFVFRVGSKTAEDHLTDVANAGSGQPVVERDRAHHACPASGARYSASGGSAQFHEAVSLEPQTSSGLSSVIASMRGCVFDLQSQPGLDVPAIDTLSVEIDGAQAARDEPDGFRIRSATQLELLGASCQRWRAPGARISFAVPCQNP